MSKQALDILSTGLRRGLSVQNARESAIHESSIEFANRLAYEPLEDALTSVGFDRELAPRIRARATTEENIDVLVNAFIVVVGGGGPAGFPTVECLTRHLPSDHEPTEEEIEAAIQACRAESGLKARVR
jgi:hypothetical protein